MVEDDIVPLDVGEDNSKAHSTPQGKKRQRFNIGEYQRVKKQVRKSNLLKKAGNDQDIKESRVVLENQEAELEKIAKKLHSTQALISKKKRKIDQLKENDFLGSIDHSKSKKPKKSSRIVESSSEKLDLSRSQQSRRKQKTVATMKTIHCGTDAKPDETKSLKSVKDGLWTTLVGICTNAELSAYVSQSKLCTEKILPGILKKKCKEYTTSQSNQIRSLRILYERGLIGKRKYTSIRNSSDVVTITGSKRNKKDEIIAGCEIPKILPYKNVAKVIKSINIGEVVSLETIAAELSITSVPGVYRTLKPFLLRLADLYLFVHEKKHCLEWFNGARNVFHVAIGADGAPFGKEDTATAYLVSFLNLVHGVQSCTNNHLLLGADCAEDHPLLISYTKLLTNEMEEMEGKLLKSERGHEVSFKFELTPGDQKWVALMCGELNNAATYFSSFADVSKNTKNTMGGSIGMSEGTWRPWEYKKRLEVVKKVEKFKKTLTDPDGKQRGKVTAFIASNNSRQEFSPPLGKYVDSCKAEPLHCTNNAWQYWFTLALAIAMQYTCESLLKSATALSDLPTICPLSKFMTCVKTAVKCGRLFKNFSRWFSEKRKRGISYCFRFTGLESKKFSWNFCFIVQELLSIDGIPEKTQVKIHALAYIAKQLRDSTAIYSRVSIDADSIESLDGKCKQYFNANCLFFGVNPSVWSIGYAIPYHARQIFKSTGFGLGLNTMQGREAKHIKLARYIQNTCNVRKDQRWWTVFRHEFISLIWLRELDPLSISYHQPCETNLKQAYIPRRVSCASNDNCNCGNKKMREESMCSICGSKVMKLIQHSVDNQEVISDLRKML